MASVEVGKKQPRLLQVGFDFGNAFCKTVIRDLDTSRAWAHQFGHMPNPLLFPNCLVRAGEKIFPHSNPAISYPPNGIWHLKRALSLTCQWQRDSGNDPLMKAYSQSLGEIFNIAPQGVILALCVFYLATAFSNIKTAIKKNWQEADSPQTYIFINMGMPDDLPLECRDTFIDVLRAGWLMADSPQADTDGMEIGKVVAIASEMLETAKNDETLRLLCNVYPETKANAQAFCRAFRQQRDDGSAWLITDAGACHVGQCAFCFSGCGDDPSFSFYLGNAIQAGSSEIERLIRDSRPFGDALEFWKREKEGRDTFAEIKKEAQDKANAKIRDIVESGSTAIYEAMNSGYVKENREMEGLAYIKNNLKFVFLGGGSLQPVYQDAVINSFNRFVPGLPGACFTAMPIGPDFSPGATPRIMPPNIFTAYGLSFPFIDLNATLPN